MTFWEQIRSIFVKKEKEVLELRAESDQLEYTGMEPDCWACGMAIHDTQKSRKLQGKRLHIFCFKRIKRIALKGGGIDEFSN